MILETARLKLKPYEIENLADFHRLMSSPLVWTYSTHNPHDTVSQSEQKLAELITKYTEDNIGFHALFEKETDMFVGEAGILSFNRTANRCVIGYNLLPDFWEKEHATEITAALINYAFGELKVERVEALAQKDNIASCKVLEKSGLQREGVLRHFSKIRDVYVDVCYYAMIASDR